MMYFDIVTKLIVTAIVLTSIYVIGWVSCYVKYLWRKEIELPDERLEMAKVKDD